MLETLTKDSFTQAIQNGVCMVAVGAPWCPDCRKIEPILEIDTNEVEASHFVTIGTYDEESLLYLNSLGIKENDAKKLLKKSFMLSIFDDNFKKEVNYE